MDMTQYQHIIWATMAIRVSKVHYKRGCSQRRGSFNIVWQVKMWRDINENMTKIIIFNNYLNECIIQLLRWYWCSHKFLLNTFQWSSKYSENHRIPLLHIFIGLESVNLNSLYSNRSSYSLYSVSLRLVYSTKASNDSIKTLLRFQESGIIFDILIKCNVFLWFLLFFRELIIYVFDASATHWCWFLTDEIL